MPLSKKHKSWAIFITLFAMITVGLIFLKKYVDKKTGASDASSKIAIESKSKFYEKDGVRYRDTNWKELVELDYQSGAKTETLTAIENTMVRIPGYIVPLADEVAVLDEFLFVPNDQAWLGEISTSTSILFRPHSH